MAAGAKPAMPGGISWAPPPWARQWAAAAELAVTDMEPVAGAPAKLPPSGAGPEGIPAPGRRTRRLRSISGITPRSTRKALASL